MKKIILLSLIALVAAGCSSPRLQDGYQIGDIAGTAVDGTVQVLTLQARYCAESDPVARAILLRLIRQAVPEYPVNGLCIDVLDALEAE